MGFAFDSWLSARTKLLKATKRGKTRATADLGLAARRLISTTDLSDRLMVEAMVADAQSEMSEIMAVTVDRPRFPQ
ncbi:MAG TPA: hypothetical protein VEH84_16550 [Alphaproteobacteria bacterium]|nr:hypothetical protein [Alphaproteobacteria bacterium]